jgi:hypothetical protein
VIYRKQKVEKLKSARSCCPVLMTHNKHIATDQDFLNETLYKLDTIKS